jgi:dTDP-4-dehydrorhamnose 3,5-epimerase
MIFSETPVKGVFLIDLEPIADERGFFARSWCQQEFATHGLSTQVVQCNVSYNRFRHTLRGLHYQVVPHQEAKLVRCVRGALYDVVLDLRPGSSTYLQHVGVELSADNRQAIHVPEGCAHGFLTLTDDTEVLYQMSAAYAAGAARGIRWDDPAFGIRWPAPVVIISQRDRSYPDFSPHQLEEMMA